MIPLGVLTPVPFTKAAPSAFANSIAISLASQPSTSNCASSSIAGDAAGLANNSPDGGTISWTLGVPVSPPAPVSLAQPEGAPPLVTKPGRASGGEIGSQYV